MAERDRKTVLHFRSHYLGLSETFIHTCITHLTRWRPVVVTGKRENADVFPLDDLAVIRGFRWPQTRLGRLLWKAERLARWRGLGAEQALHAKLTDELRRVAQRRDARVIHAHFAEEGLTVLDGAKAAGRPLITSFYGRDISQAVHSETERRRLQPLCEQGALFIVEGPHMRELAVRAGCAPERVRLQRIAIDLELLPFLSPRREPGRPIRVLLASRFVEKKGIPYGVRAVALARREVKDMELWLIGDGPARAEVDRALAESGLEAAGGLKRYPFLKYDEYRRVARETDIYLAPSVVAADGDAEGGAPTTLLEMQAMGKPIVATRHADIPYVVRDGESAFLADERDVEGLAAALVRVASAPERWEAMGRAGRAHVAANHDVRTEVAALEAIYDELAGGPS